MIAPAARTRITKRLRDISADNRSGASQLALRALGTLALAAPKRGAGARAYRSSVQSLARALVGARPVMAGVGGTVARALHEFLARTARVIDASDAFAELVHVVREHERKARRARMEIVDNYRASFGGLRRIMTISCSSQVVDALTLPGKHPRAVTVCESRPRFEGRRLARIVSDSVDDVTIIIEAQIPSAMRRCDAVLIGCDAVFPDGAVVNKTGSRLLALAARDAGCPVIVLADTTKITPRRGGGEAHPPEEVWAGAPRTIHVANDYFEEVPARLVRHIVTEERVSTTRAVAGMFAKTRKFRAALTRSL